MITVNKLFMIINPTWLNMGQELVDSLSDIFTMFDGST